MTPNSPATRQMALRWISALFARELTADDVESYRSGDGETLLDTLQSELDCGEAVEPIRSRLNDSQPASDTALDLAGDFAWLFHGVGGPRSAPPHEHDWSEASDGTQMECIDQCLSLMGKCGLGPSPESGETVDHVGTQLELLGYLEEQAVADPNGPWNEYRDTLIREHLDKWLPLFLDACENNDRNGFYAAVAELAGRLLDGALSKASVRRLAANIGQQPTEEES
ncbi:MAG: molecular chaperone TorD family protein [Desulfovibrionaceae bacterium]|nr:molecular chaperone TorD family protein [Desulfovibrionaceae bacterium]